jgi:hypothetical protein
LRHRYTETDSDYLTQFREVRNQCYNLTIAEKDLTDLAFVGLTPYLKDKLDGQEISDINQLMQRVLPYENNATSSRFRTALTRTRRITTLTSWMRRLMMRREMRFVKLSGLKKPGDKPISCSFLKPNGGRREEIHF